MSAHSRRMFATLVRRDRIDLALACHLIAAEAGPETNPAETSRALDLLAADTAPLIAARGAAGRGWAQGDPDNAPPGPAGTPDTGADLGAGTLTGLDLRLAAEALREALGERAGFAGHEADYDDVRASLLPEVLSRRRGLPILLSVVWLEVARRVGLPAYAIGLPGHVIVAIGSPNENVLVDPYAGGRIITVHDAAAKVRAAGVAFTRAHLAPMSAEDLLARILGNIRVLAARTDVPRTRLWAVELALLLPHHPAALRRERGELRVRLGDLLGGSRDLTSFADAVEAAEPAAAAAARQASLAARARLN